MQFIKDLIVKAILSGGWKTYAAAVGAILVGVGSFLQGAMDFETASALVLGGLAVFGLGHKLQKLLDTFKQLVDFADREDEAQ